MNRSSFICREINVEMKACMFMLVSLPFSAFVSQSLHDCQFLSLALPVSFSHLLHGAVCSSRSSAYHRFFRLPSSCAHACRACARLTISEYRHTSTYQRVPCSVARICDTLPLAVLHPRTIAYHRGTLYRASPSW